MVFLPLVYATSQTQPFPDIPFHVFSEFIQKTFNSEVSLATVLLKILNYSAYMLDKKILSFKENIKLYFRMDKIFIL
ncbi:hypothetical protein CVT25_004109 [Psilocybe cyanescens]|uniref:Uncharacterized protein n=1 Tax=Psilocybe cyanescens TaxID=93625 RepID=A0A409X317_PSICY|nr:hypothetical protein CVT25_004109 [Psilocybe cyanescens]